MKGLVRILVVIVCASHFAALPARAEPTTLDKPIYVEAFVRNTTGGRDEKVAGDLLRYDDDWFIIQAKRPGATERELKWLELTPSSAYVIKSRLIDKNDAHAWLELGRFGWAVNASQQARAAFANAVRLDATLKKDVADILATQPGEAIRKAAAEAKEREKESQSASKEESPSSEDPTKDALPGSDSSQGGSAGPLQKYLKSTPKEDANAIAAARKRAEQVSSKMGLKFAEIQTDHFILFTDWDPREFDFLKENVEAANAVVSEQFEIPAKENVFIGKLPVFMFSKQDDFMKFASTIDGFGAGKSVLGYYQGRTDGIGHMAMWKPDIAASGGNRQAAEYRWGYVLTHEFTHAFVARYRTNAMIPRWLNEGVAEVIANKKFPKQGARIQARTMSTRATTEQLTELFNDAKMPGGDMYPVMMTMVETLITRDRSAFLKYFDDLKAGKDRDAALMEHYKLDKKSFIAAWKSYVMSSK